MRPLPNSLGFCAALSLLFMAQDALNTDEAFRTAPVAERLKTIRETISAIQADEPAIRLPLAQYWGFRNCISGYWRNC